jgi:hypothetical protein
MTNEPSSKQIVVGAAAFFISDAQSPLTDLTAGVGKAADLIAADSNWKNVGYTEGGVEVQYEPTYTDVMVDQLLDSALIFKSGMKVQVNTTLSEATLENLLVTWGQASTSLASSVLSIEGGSLGDYPHERGVAFVGPGPRTVSNNNERIYHVERAIQTQTTNHFLKRDAATTLPVSFRCLPGSPNSGVSQTSYGTVRDRAYT